MNAFFKVGQRIEMIMMPGDPDPIPSGTQGTIIGVHDHSSPGLQLSVNWDNGRKLMVVIPPDSVKVIDG